MTSRPSTPPPSSEVATRALRALRVMRGVAHAQSAARTESELLQTVCDQLVVLGAFRLAWIGFAEHDEVRTVRPVAHAGIDREYLEGLDVRWSDDSRGRGPTGTAIRTGEIVVVRDIRSEAAYEPWRSKAVGRGIASSIALPVFSDDHCIGALNLYSAESDAFDADEQALLGELAAMISQSLAGFRARVEREDAIAALRESEERFRQLADNVSSIFYVLTVDHSRVLYVNRAVERMWGIPRDEIYRDASAFRRVIHPDDLPRIGATVAKSPFEYEVEYRIVLPEQGTRWIRVRAFPVRDEHGRVVRLAGLGEDVTDSKAADEARRKLDAQSEQSRRIEGQRRLAAGIAHDFNNLLAVMMNHAAIARRAVPDPHPVRDDLRGIEEAIQHAVRLTRQLVLFSQKAEAPAELLDINVIVDEMRRVLDTAAGENVALAITLDAGTPCVNVVRSHLEQILLNLVINAGEAMPGGGTVRVTTGAGELLGRRAARLVVSDDGPGMSEEQRLHAFEPFYSTKDTNVHTGLGLAIVYGAVQQAEGDVSLEGDEKGTRVVVLLPEG